MGGRTVWIGLALTYLLMFGASELVAEGGGVFHEVYYPRRSDVTFFREDHQLSGARRREADKMEVRFRGSKGDYGRNR